MESQFLHEHKVDDIVKHKGRLVEVPYTATVGDTLQALHAKDILAVPVAAPPGEWIGAGGTMIIERDAATGAARKQYIGIVSIMDALVHLTEKEKDLDSGLATPVSTIIGHSLESLSLWTMSAKSSLYEAMEPMGKGVHRMLVPILDHSSHSGTVHPDDLEMASSYKMLSQTDIIRFLLEHAQELESIMGSTADSLGVMQKTVFCILDDMLVTDAFKCMHRGGINAAAVIARKDEPADDPMLVQGQGREVLATLSASDLRGCNADVLRELPSLTVMEFLAKISLSKTSGFSAVFGPHACKVITGETLSVPHSEDEAKRMAVPRAPVTCPPESTLGNIMAAAIGAGIHRVWITDVDSHLIGVVTFSDIIKAMRRQLSQGGSSGKL